MIERWCDFLLRRAANRWADQGEMLAEWRAELHSISSDKDKMWYALSLAAARPHRTRTVALQRAFPGFLMSFLALLLLPYAYSLAAMGWWTMFSQDTVVGQSWLAVGCTAGAIVLGLALARMSAGLTRVIRPDLLPAWVFGVLFLPELTEALLAPNALPRAHLIDHTVWVGGAIVCGILVVRLTMRGRTGLSWLLIATATPVVFFLSKLHGIQHYFGEPMMAGLFGGSAVAGFVFEVATQYLLHLTIFGLVYTRGLAARRAMALR